MPSFRGHYCKRAFCLQQETLEQIGLQSGAQEESAAVRHHRRVAENLLGDAVADRQHRHDGHLPSTGAPSSSNHSQPELRERRLLSVRAAAPRVPADHHLSPAASRPDARVPDHQAARVVAHPHRAPQHAAVEPVPVHTPDLGSGIALNRFPDAAGPVRSGPVSPVNATRPSPPPPPPPPSPVVHGSLEGP